MALSELVTEAPDHWPSLDELKEVAVSDTIVILPDRLESVDGKLVAAFRLDSQGIRVAASDAGLTPVLHAPADAEKVIYTENAADWVLPVVVAFALAVPGQIGATLVADWIESSLAQHPTSTAQTVLYREAVVEHGELRLYQIEGSAQEVVILLRQRADLNPPTPTSSEPAR